MPKMPEVIRIRNKIVNYSSPRGFSLGSGRIPDSVEYHPQIGNRFIR